LTEEQLIVLGFLVAAFVVGWLARALVGRRDRRAAAAVPAAISREDLERAVQATREELDRAIRSHVAAVALSVRARDGAPPEGTQPEGTQPEPAQPDPSPVPPEPAPFDRPEPAPARSPAPMTPEPSGVQPDALAAEVSAALRDDAANECMLSAVDARRGAALSERELDLTDWGFAYGVAWARAHEQTSNAADDTVARAALQAAELVFRAYAAEAEWAHQKGNGRTGPRPRG
jgi:hypothetical protein